MVVVHALPGIKTMGVRPELVAGCLDLGTSQIFGGLTGPGKHVLSDALAPAGGTDHKFQNLRNLLGVVELLLQP